LYISVDDNKKQEVKGMSEKQICEKTKKHLMEMFSGLSEDRINKIIEENYKYFNYISQPKQKAVAIASVI
jgi:hypothetical protein